jgi:hypothetical protein
LSRLRLVNDDRDEGMNLAQSTKSQIFQHTTTTMNSKRIEMKHSCVVPEFVEGKVETGKVGELGQLGEWRNGAASLQFVL